MVTPPLWTSDADGQKARPYHGGRRPIVALRGRLRPLAASTFGGDGFDNVTGMHGAGRVIGQVIQLIGVVAALVAGTLHTRASRSRP